MTDTKKGPFIPQKPSSLPFNSQEIYQRDLKWLVHLAKQKGWKEFAWDDAKKLDAHPSGLWKGIKDDLVKEMTNGRSKEDI